jgi:hypothetical protein
MLVNCENSRMRRPSASISGSISIRCSSLAEALTFLAALQFEQMRVAADLAQFEQRVQDGDL